MAPIYGVEHRWRDRRHKHWSPWLVINDMESATMSGAWKRTKRWDFRLGTWLGKKLVGLEHQYRVVVVDVHELGDEWINGSS